MLSRYLFFLSKPVGSGTVPYYLGTYLVFTGEERERGNNNESMREERALTNLYGYILILVGTYLLNFSHINRRF